MLGYSSVAQLGFIMLGIFALDPEGRGAQGAVLQMVNHGLVVAPLFLIIVLLAERTGTEDITKMGGLAFRAPVLAALFLIVALATLAMPGSANFVGEFLILLGLFQTKLAISIIAFTGVAMASVYMLRMFIRTMHNRAGTGTESRELSLADAVVLVPLVLAIIAFALYPQARADGVRAGDQGRDPGRWCREGPAYRLGGDLAAGGADGGRLPRADGRAAAAGVRARTLVPVMTIVTLGVAVGLGVWQWDDNELVVAGALAIDDLTLALTDGLRGRRAGGDAAVGALAGGGRGRARRVPRAVARSRCSGWSCWRARRTW